MKCFSCGAKIENVKGVTHPYMLSSPGCWQLYQSILQKEYSDPRFFKANQFTVDTYAIQHYGKKEVPQAVSSVGIHLSSLYLLLNSKIEVEEAAEFKSNFANYNKKHHHLTWLEPPSIKGQLNITHLNGIENTDRYIDAVRDWAESTWDAWSYHHNIIESWVDQYLSSII